MGSGENQRYICNLKCVKGGKKKGLLIMQRPINC